ncbi:LamG domain-containing protein [Candidatus Saccharibacteria bacterium]|nr:LamG domain-containing protein [Candidatus Saccharibacteria bacterium]
MEYHRTRHTGKIDHGSVGTSYKSVVFDDAPIGYWPLDEAVGSTFTDQSGNARNGVYSGSLAYAQASMSPNIPETCINFSGGMGYIGSASWMNTQYISVEFICEPSGSGNRTIASRDNSSTYNNRDWVMLLDSSNAMQWVVYTNAATGGSGGDPPAAYSASATGMHHWVGTYDGSQTRLYKDGVLVGSASPPGSSVNTYANPFRVGRLGGDYLPFAGKIQGFALYDHPLSAGRILTHAQAAGFA